MARPDPIPSFAVEPAPLRGAPGVAVRGEVDIGTAPALDVALSREIRESAGAFVIDLCEVGFLDSSGLNVLIRARALLGSHDRQLALVCVPGRVRELFATTGIE